MKLRLLRKYIAAILAMVTIFAFAGCGAAPASDNEIAQGASTGSTELDLDEDVLYFGRTYADSDAHWFNWSGSGFSFRFKGSGATAEFYSNVPETKHMAYIKIYVDGTEMKDILLNEEYKTVVLAEGLDPDQEHTVEVRKRTNARSSTAGVHCIEITDGAILEPAQPKERLVEFLGDSLTLGFVAAKGGKSALAWSTSTEDVTRTYCPQIANAFDAEYQVVAVSGRGIVRNNGGDTEYLFPELYRQLDLYNNDGVEYDFETQPDVIVINLGTNDESDSNTDLSEDVFKEGLYQFLKEVRQYNPNAQIIYTYGLVRVTLSGAIEAVVNRLRSEGDSNLHYLQLKQCESWELNLNHTVEKAYVSRGEAIIEKIQEVTGWQAAG